MIPSGWHGIAAVQLLAMSGFFATGTVLSIVDLRTHRLPDRIVFPTLWAGLLLNVGEVFTSPADAVFGAAAGYLLLRVPTLVYEFGHGGRPGFGGGDIKLSAAMGAWFGVQGVLVTLLIAFVAGTCAVLPGLVSGRRGLTQRVPFGPAIVLGGTTVLLAGPATIIRVLLGPS